MSSGGGATVSIPSSVRKMIHNIKEIASQHSDDEIYAMLQECSMDPNEATQKLLFQDTFHEVKRKRDRRKENLNKESTESKWKPGTQGRGNRGRRGNYSPRYITHDARGGKNSALGKETGNNQVSEKGPGTLSLPRSQETKNKEPTPVASSSIAMINGPTGECMPNSDDCTASMTTAIYFSASDPVLLPSQDSRLPSVVGTIKREVGSKQTPVEKISVTSAESKSTAAPSKVGSSFMHGKMPSKHQGAGKNNLSESSQAPSSTHGSSSVSRASSNYSSRTQQVIGPQKVVYSKEWKPKPINPSLPQGTVTALSSEVSSVSVEADIQSEPALSVLDSKEATSELQSKLEEMDISDGHHVIIPNHLHVPDAEKLGFCFGSFDTSFELNTSNDSRPESDKSPPPLSETSEEIEETVEQSSRLQNTSSPAEGDYSEYPQSTLLVPEKSGEVDVSSSVVPEYSESKQESATPGGHQYSAVHTSSGHGFGFLPPMLGSQVAPYERSEPQALDVSHLPGFVVQQPFDPASYYGQFYRPGTDTDGRVSPFHSAGVALKYGGNVAVVSPQTSQSPQEGGNSFMLSVAGPSPLGTQAAGVMQSSITQQPLPVFRQPTGLHLPHYPPNYIPYGHYFSPFYVPPPAIHQFLSNGSFPQQPQAGSVYPAPPLATAKYSLSQHKPGVNTGNSTHVGVTSSYGPYSSSVSGYNPSSAAPAGNSTSNEDLSTSQFKESNTYVTSGQSEGLGAWIAAPDRDISGLQASSLYNLPHGQLAFTPTQAGHVTFPGIYHPPQTMTAATVHPLIHQSQAMAGSVDMAGPTGNSIYQPPQPAQINWPGSY